MTARPAPYSAAFSAPDPRVGVVVLTYNRAGELLRSLGYLAALPERPEIVVIDNGSTDGTATQVSRQFPGILCVPLKENLGAAGRNAGVELCERPYIALCDDDCWWEPGSLRRAADLLDAHPELAIVTGTVLVGASERMDPTCLRMARSPLPRRPGLPGTPLLGFLAGASVIRRSAFLQAGGFERRLFLGGEETLLGLDLAATGWSMAYVPELVIHHYPSIHRDAGRRNHALIRNSLWIAWLRRPLPRAAAITLRVLRRCAADPAARRALAEALRSLPWALRNRRVVPGHVEDGLRLLGE